MSYYVQFYTNRPAMAPKLLGHVNKWLIEAEESLGRYKIEGYPDSELTIESLHNIAKYIFDNRKKRGYHYVAYRIYHCDSVISHLAISSIIEGAGK